MVRTGAHAFVMYDFETGYGSGATPNKKFGLQDKLTSLSLTNNRQNLAKLNSNTIDKFAYGQQQGSASMGFTLSNPWIFGALLGAPVTTGSSAPYTHSYNTAANLKTPRTVSLEVGLDGASADIVRTLKGGIVNNISISAAVGGLVECSADITFGQESQPSTSLGNDHVAPTKPVQEFPYTFAHAELLLDGVTVVQCQDVNLSIAQNSELLYGLNSHAAVDSFRRILDITGSFRASWINSALLLKLLQQVKADSGNSNAYVETAHTALKLVFKENATNQQIEITCTGLSIGDQSISGLEPAEPIFEEINWQVKTIAVVAKSTTAAEE
jgi:hypothetical protein